jgi:hypothetical protein
MPDVDPLDLTLETWWMARINGPIVKGLTVPTGTRQPCPITREKAEHLRKVLIDRGAEGGGLLCQDQEGQFLLFAPDGQ